MVYFFREKLRTFLIKQNPFLKKILPGIPRYKTNADCERVPQAVKVLTSRRGYFTVWRTLQANPWSCEEWFALNYCSRVALK